MSVELTLLTDITKANDGPRIAPAPQRAVGQLSVAAGAQSRLSGLRQQGSLKALFPRVRLGEPLEAVFLNTSGGLTGGDKMDISVDATEGARVIVSSQAAERVYRAPPGPSAQTEVTLRAGGRSRIDWLPQETIVFDGSALTRSLQIDLDTEATALIVEPVILGRAAMGETVRNARFRDRWTVRRNGDLIFADALWLDGDVTDVMAQIGTAQGATAWASVLFASPSADAAVEELRDMLPSSAGLSLVRSGVLFLRILASDGFELRRGLIPIIERLSGAGLPKVWRL